MIIKQNIYEHLKRMWNQHEFMKKMIPHNLVSFFSSKQKGVEEGKDLLLFLAIWQTGYTENFS